MRLYQLSVLALVVAAIQTGCANGVSSCNPKLPFGVPFSCPDPQNHDPGTSQGLCRSGALVTSFCDPELTCIDGVCIPCGYAGGPCCALPDGEHCDNAATVCDQNENLSWPTCPGQACQVGDPCCDNGGCADGMCSPDTNLCEAKSTACVPGSVPFTLSLVDQFGCVPVSDVPFTSDNATDAQACADAYLAAHNPDGTLHLGPLNTDPTTCESFCEDSSDGKLATSACAFTSQELATCEQSLCSGDCMIDHSPTCPQ